MDASKVLHDSLLPALSDQFTTRVKVTPSAGYPKKSNVCPVSFIGGRHTPS